jgi:acetyl esterase/lipase
MDTVIARPTMTDKSPGTTRTSSVALTSASIAISLVLTLFGVTTGENNASLSGDLDRTVMAQTSGSPDGQLGVDSRLRDVLHHQAFAEFARLLLPWDGRTYDEDMRLSEIASLLPYHSHVSPMVVVSALNHMIDDARNEKTIFYNIYSDAQKRDEPAREHTGLFFFRGSPGAPFAIIAPGGGFSYVASVHEGFPYAVEISKKGYNAFVLKYRAGYGGTVATQDLAAAISYVFRNAEMLGVSTEAFSLWGSSAGARMVAAIGTSGVAAYGGGNLRRPAAIIMAYTAHSDHSSADPPTFAIVGENDGIAPPVTMETRVAALRQAGVEVEYHKYKDLGHGFGLGSGTSAEGWISDAIRFWEKFMQRKR